jgi:hypothetical protein
VSGDVNTSVISRYCADPEKKPRLLPRLLGMAALAAALILSFAAAKDFNTNFPLVESAKIIAHRGGGTLANENTVLSLEAAAEYGAFGSEIDVQRSADDHYVINHDENFLRCCNDSRKQYRLHYYGRSGTGGCRPAPDGYSSHPGAPDQHPPQYFFTYIPQASMLQIYLYYYNRYTLLNQRPTQCSQSCSFGKSARS